jgi:hypothetical protein
VNITLITSGPVSYAIPEQGSLLLETVQDGLDLLSEIGQGGADRLILHAGNINPLFYDLSSGFAGELLQKFANYHVRVAVVGPLPFEVSTSFHEWKTECNRGRQVRFAETLEEAVAWIIRI